MKQKRIKGMSLFSSAGIGEYFLKDLGIDIIVANELIEKRGSIYKYTYPFSNMVIGDIKNEEIFNKICQIAKKEQVDFMIASPPCQGISVAGKNRNIYDMCNDERNYLITYVIKMIHEIRPSYILIENVPLLLKLNLIIDGELINIIDLLNKEFKEIYNIDSKILDTSDYGIPQIRKRAIIKLHRKDCIWKWPQKNNVKITVMDAIGDLPSIESGDISMLKWHFGRKHSDKHILWMKNTPTGKSAFENDVFFPKKDDGTPIKGYKSSYRRIKWDEPSPTITIRNDAISSQRNVHPGRIKKDGTYSDARVLSILELMRLTGLPDDWRIPDNTPEILIRQILGECIPPHLVRKLAEEIFDND